MTEPDGWRVLDPDGNVIASGPVTLLEMTTELAEATGPEDGNGSD